MPRIPRALGDILTHSGSAAALVAQIREQSALLALVKRELEASVSAHLLAALIRKKQLVLYTDSSAWASRLRFGSRALRDRLIDRGVKIEKLTVRITLPSGNRGTNRHAARRLSLENSILIEKTAKTIDDSGLRQALERLSRHGR